MKKLLVAVDGSDNATRAIQYATSLAKLTGGEIHLLTVCEDHADAERAHAFHTIEDLQKASREKADGYLSAAEAVVKAGSVPVTRHVTFGDNATTIVRISNELGCDGIVMGTRGLGWLANIMLGSTSAKVLALTELPVTLVK